MDVNFFISEMLTTLIFCGAILIFWQLKISKNGILRKILMGYFLVEAFIYMMAGIFWWCAYRSEPFISIEGLRIITLVPKAVIKIIFLWWVVKQNRKRKS